MTVRLDTLRAALWRAIAHALAKPTMPRDERRKAVAAGEHVEAMLTAAAPLWETEDSRSRPDAPASETQGDRAV